jgi:hypothetical protein
MPPPFGVYPPPHMTCMHPPPHMTCMHPPPFGVYFLDVCVYASMSMYVGWANAAAISVGSVQQSI